MSFIMRWRQLERSRKILLLIFLVLGLGFSFQVSNYLLEKKIEEVHSRFDRISDQHVHALHQDFLLAFDLVYALAGLFEASDHVNKKEFDAFTQRIMQTQPAVAALEWIPRVPKSELARWKEENKIELKFLDADESIHQNVALEDREFYFPVELVSGERSLSWVVGLDQMSRTASWRALLEAVRTQEVVLTDALDIMGSETENKGFQVLLPVGGSSDISKVQGFVAGVFYYRKVLKSSLERIKTFEDDIRIEWNIPGAPILRHPKTDEKYPEMSKWLSWLYIPVGEKIVQFKVGNVSYQLSYKPSDHFRMEAGTILPYFCCFLLGCILCIFVLTYITLLTLKNKEVEMKVQQRTENLEDSRSFLFNLVDNLPIGVFCKDIENDFRFTIWNRAMEEITGISREDALGKSDFDLFPQSEAEAFRSADKKVVMTGQSVHIAEESLKRTTGEYKILSTTKAPLNDRSGRPVTLLGIAVDISEQMEMQNALKDSQERFALAIRGAHDGIWDWNISDQSVFCSERFRQLLQLPQDAKLSPESLCDLVFPADKDRFFRAVQRHLDGGREFDLELRLVVNGNDIRWYHLTGQAVWDDKGKATRMVGSLSDIHLRKTTEEQLIRTSRLAGIGEMAAGVAHEINNPVTILIGRLDEMRDYLKKRNFEPEVFLKKLNSAHEVTERVTRIVKALRSSSRDGTNDSKIPCSLKSIVEDSLSLCIEKFRYNDIDVVVSEMPEDLQISCRSTEILQVFMNLLANAFDSFSETPEKHWIRISTEIDGEYVKMYFENNGTKIPSADKERIFEPFFTTKEVGKGTGLGLSISRNIIENHGGKLSVEIEPFTKFVIQLPLTKVEEKAA